MGGVGAPQAHATGSAHTSAPAPLPPGQEASTASDAVSAHTPKDQPSDDEGRIQQRGAAAVGKEDGDESMESRHDVQGSGGLFKAEQTTGHLHQWRQERAHVLEPEFGRRHDARGSDDAQEQEGTLGSDDTMSKRDSDLCEAGEHCDRADEPTRSPVTP